MLCHIDDSFNQNRKAAGLKAKVLSLKMLKCSAELKETGLMDELPVSSVARY